MIKKIIKAAMALSLDLAQLAPDCG